MLVTKIVYINKKNEVYVDEAYLFSLYYKELKRYHIAEDMSIDEILIKTIFDEVIIPRGLNYMGHLLSRQDYTQHKVEEKLKRARYGEYAIEKIIDKLTTHGFLNDRIYAKKFYEQHKNNLSHKVLQQKLMMKGIDKQLITEIVEKNEGLESNALRKCILKKTRNIEMLTQDKKDKLIRFLIGKGFQYTDIKKSLSDIFDE